MRGQRFEPDGRYVDAWTHLGATQCIEFYRDELWVITHRTIGELLGWDSLGGRIMRLEPLQRRAACPCISSRKESLCANFGLTVGSGISPPAGT